jgi:hypothetical protein
MKSVHRSFGTWSAIAGALFLIVAIFGRHTWDWSRIACLMAGIGNIAISVREFRRAKSS